MELVPLLISVRAWPWFRFTLFAHGGGVYLALILAPSLESCWTFFMGHVIYRTKSYRILRSLLHQLYVVVVVVVVVSSILISLYEARGKRVE